MSDEEGTTLIELMVAIIIMGVSFAALSGVVVSSLSAQLNNERESVATATAQQLIEEFQATGWDSAAVYRNEVDDPTDPNAVRYRSRLSGSSNELYDTHELVTLPDPGADGRDDAVPTPWFTDTRQGLEYAVDVYPVWFDPDGDGSDDHRRFFAVASWEGRNGGTRELVVAGERAPTQQEAESGVDGHRATFAVVSPRRTILDYDEYGMLVEDVTVQVRFNRGVNNPKVTFSRLELTFDGDGNATSATATSETLTMTTTEWATGPLTLAATVTIPANTYYLRNGGNTLLITATSGIDTVSTSLSLDAVGGPWEADDATPPDDEEEEEEPPTYTDPVNISSASANSQVTVCVNNKWELTQAIVVGVTVDGMDKDSGTVSVTVPYWSKKTGNASSDPDQAVTVGATYTADLNPNPVFPREWQMEMPPDATQLFKPGEKITLTVVASRDDGASDIAEINNVQVKSC